MKRPPVPLRIAIVVAAVACLGLAMCGRSKPPQQQPGTTNTQQAPDNANQQQPANAPQTPPQQPPPPPPEEGKMDKDKIDHFPATKAPGRLY